MMNREEEWEDGLEAEMTWALKIKKEDERWLLFSVLIFVLFCKSVSQFNVPSVPRGSQCMASRLHVFIKPRKRFDENVGTV